MIFASEIFPKDKRFYVTPCLLLNKGIFFQAKAFAQATIPKKII